MPKPTESCAGCEYLQVRLQKADAELAKLREFYRDVARMTLHHDVLGESAVVYPSNLGVALAKIDPEWWKVVVNKVLQG